jgi:hypothetical protein
MVVYEDCDLPDGSRALPVKGVLTRKRDELGNFARYKHRCMVIRSQHVMGRDYGEFFAAVESTWNSAFLDSMCVKLVEDNFAFESIFEDVVSFDEEGRAAEAVQLVQEDTGIWSLESEDNEGGEEEEDLDLFA